ncbi:MAG TPA: outer membrane lipoprotein chaperone LolA [Bacteroidota bacterium]|nr:outer membrane lipoprotein chaperone LolA [Bacteroidota bacterium]
MRKFSLIVFAGLVFQQAAAQQISMSELTSNMQRRYETIENVVAKFAQQVKFGFSNIEQRFTGTLIMKKPRMYRIESEHQTLVTDGTTVWAYSPVNKQVVIDKYKEKQNSISPDLFLLNLPSDYYSTLLGKETEAEKSLLTVKLVPKDDRSFIKSVKLWIVDGTWDVRKILIVDVNETETLYVIDRLSQNTAINDSLFSFSPPPGTEIVDLR